MWNDSQTTFLKIPLQLTELKKNNLIHMVYVVMADTMSNGEDNNSKEELMDTPIITHTQDISTHSNNYR